jgi:hypothetical protein
MPSIEEAALYQDLAQTVLLYGRLRRDPAFVEAATRLLAQAWSLALESGDDKWVGAFGLGQADLLLAVHQRSRERESLDGARARALESLDRLERAGNARWRARAIATVGRTDLARGDSAAAELRFRTAGRMLESSGDLRGLAEVLGYERELFEATGDAARLDMVERRGRALAEAPARRQPRIVTSFLRIASALVDQSSSSSPPPSQPRRRKKSSMPPAVPAMTSSKSG